MQYDLMIVDGHVIDPAQNLNGPADVAFTGGKVSAIGIGLDRKSAKAVRSAAGLTVIPGIIDLHTHVYWGGTGCGIDPDKLGRDSGTTTSIDAGTAGAGNFLGFRKHVIERSEVRILAYLNISYPGIFGLGPVTAYGEAQIPELMNIEECVRVAREHPDLIIGVKVRIGYNTSGSLGIGALDLAREAAELLGLPMMAHVGPPPPRFVDILERLRPGDVLTHCCRPTLSHALDTKGRVLPVADAARKMGVIFDVGHGAGAFSFETAAAMLKAGFPPDVISSDVHIRSIDGPAYSALHTMSKMLCLGMPLPDVIRAVTEAPAKAVRRPELGNLKPGAPGDAVLLEIQNGRFDYLDTVGMTLAGKQRLALRGTVLGGRWWNDGEAR
ncbi:MAG: amidohydrolase/deacetylase family metallohydrolase [Alphaproteobacteria bacterium]|nr:amidohydrolase/deacetylase family metallohydrolase [Alphaproteobacteria bacterium]